MTGSFWAGAIPGWAYVVGVLVCAAALCTGMWAGYGRGWEHCEEDQSWAREQAKARRVHPVYRVPPEVNTEIRRAYQLAGVPVPPEVAHDWPEHEATALAIANERGVSPYGCVGPSSPEQAGHHLKDPIGPPDPRTDSQWTADHIADLHAFMEALLGQYPAVEEL